MEIYECITLILPFVIVNFCMDYLSDSEILADELKIGIVQFIHHIILFIHSFVIFGPFIKPSILLIILITAVNIGVQIGWTINNDYCWLTTLTNRLIGTKCKNRKWISEISSLIKHYIRGDDWAYTEMYNTGRNSEVIKLNTLLIIILIKIIVKRTRHGYI